jgi:hypothetical protein
MSGNACVQVLAQSEHDAQASAFVLGARCEIFSGGSHNRCTRLRVVLVFAALLLCTAGCARYQVGAQSLYSPDITTVYVPMIESHSLRRYLGERLTEAVVKEIESKTPYKVVDSEDADSILSARLVGDTKKIKTNNRYDDGRENQISFKIEASWIDRRGEIIRRDLAVPLDPALVSMIETGNYIPEIGQSVSTAQQTAIQRTAEQIVAMMEIPW